MKKPLRHIIEYMILCAVLSMGIIALIILNGLPQVQTIVVIATALAYFIWGFFHHKREGSANPKTLSEYAIYATLGGILIIGLI